MKRKKHKWQNGFGECAQHKIIIVIFWYAVRSVGVNDDAFWDSACIMCVRCVFISFRFVFVLSIEKNHKTIKLSINLFQSFPYCLNRFFCCCSVPFLINFYFSAYI